MDGAYFEEAVALIRSSVVDADEILAMVDKDPRASRKKRPAAAPKPSPEASGDEPESIYFPSRERNCKKHQKACCPKNLQPSILQASPGAALLPTTSAAVIVQRRATGPGSGDSPCRKGGILRRKRRAFLRRQRRLRAVEARWGLRKASYPGQSRGCGRNPQESSQTAQCQAHHVPCHPWHGEMGIVAHGSKLAPGSSSSTRSCAVAGTKKKQRKPETSTSSSSQGSTRPSPEGYLPTEQCGCCCSCLHS